MRFLAAVCQEDAVRVATLPCGGEYEGLSSVFLTDARGSIAARSGRGWFQQMRHELEVEGWSPTARERVNRTRGATL